ncbi:gamma-glutamyltransferase [Lacipirellula limnantheis]|uniref:Glutathione hydrolase proenzyme n=1 Tax=Lacipirellula limnantheis TaxID=2528024 RepID=A0A517U3G6_9BACT|nr:gamma-glutamyltransferase [Lacipirellula limnantheis]QDT75168.1 Gamma-glutamyltranspeptidase precursor [Lacipirellula limnantheis]
MKLATTLPIIPSLFALLLAGCSQTAAPPKREATTAQVAPAEELAVCMVASVQPLATDAGVAAFEAGGNAVDAAVAAALTLGVVDNHNSGLGGGCFILIRRADGTLVAIDGREEAPAAATRDMFLRDGEADPELSQTGPLAVAIPGALAACDLAASKYGNLPLKELLLPAAKIAEDGFAIDRVYAGKLAASAKSLDKFAGSRAALLKSDGSAYKEGDILKQPDLARSYRAVAEEGTNWFYGGPFADKVARWMADNGGLITQADFASYLPVEREPLETTYRDWTIVGFPPPSSGGVHVAQMLNILETFDLKKTYQDNPAQALHLVAETMKLAFADRAFWLGDPDAVDVPRGLIDKGYAVALAERINPERATDVPGHGEPPAAAEDVFGKKHTTHITAADSDGNWVAITATVNTTFGSKVIVPGTGIVLNNEMDDFSAQPGKPNAFGLVGAENNAVAPGKRPLSSMTPTIVLKGGKPVMTVGSAGGPKIITSVLLAILRRLDFKQSLAEAIAAPRIHQQWMPDVLTVEKKMPPEVVDQLMAKGHKIDEIESGAVAQAIEVDENGQFVGVHDPRVPGRAASGTRPRK